MLYHLIFVQMAWSPIIIFLLDLSSASYMFTFRYQIEFSIFWGFHASSARGSISYLDERAPQDTLTCIFCPPVLNIFVLMRALMSQKMASIFAWRGRACFCLTVNPVNWLSRTIRSFTARLLLWKLTHIGPMRFVSFSEGQGRTCPSSSTSSSSLSSSSSCRVYMFGWDSPRYSLVILFHAFKKFLPFFINIIPQTFSNVVMQGFKRCLFKTVPSDTF